MNLETPPADPIFASHQRHREALRTSNLNSLVSFFNDEAVFMPSNDATLHGRTDIRKWYEEYFQFFRIESLIDSEREVTMLGDLGLERFSFAVTILPVNGGDAIRDDGRFMAVWKKQIDGEWKMSQAMFNSIRPIGSGTSRFIARISEQKPRE
jgi:ketosteroid isomerase-like protein